MNRIFFIADQFYHPENINTIGGAEKCNHVLTDELFATEFNDFKDYMFVQMICSDLNKKIIDKNLDSIFIISNFMTLAEEVKEYLIEKSVDYIILEHDHKYLKNNNPAEFKDLLSNEEDRQNTEFFKHARVVLCQTDYASRILFKNTQAKNIVSLSGNLWLDSEIDLLERLLDESPTPSERENKWGVLRSKNPNKGVPETVAYCLENKIPHSSIGNIHYESFMREVSNCEGIIMFPRWIETFNRFLCESRALDCKVMTNQNVGCVQDGWMKYKGKDMIEKMKSCKQEIFEKFRKLIRKENLEFLDFETPRVTIMTTFVEAEEFIEGYLDSIVNQTIFEEVDLLIYDSGSTGKESEIISKYCEKYKNIKHIRDEEKIPSSEAFNKMIEASENDLIGMVMIDDRPAPYYAEILRHYLHFSSSDLVYGDCVQSYTCNAKIDEKFYTSKNLYEHSIKDFSRENMIKSLPGPMPMFKKSMINRCGGFDSNFKHANDWELWLRCVRSGSSFLKVHSKVGLYYFNPQGVTTSTENFTSKIKEEASLFMEYKDVIGEQNFNKYKQYFSQGL